MRKNELLGSAIPARALYLLFKLARAIHERLYEDLPSQECCYNAERPTCFQAAGLWQPFAVRVQIRDAKRKEGHIEREEQ